MIKSYCKLLLILKFLRIIALMLLLIALICSQIISSSTIRLLFSQISSPPRADDACLHHTGNPRRQCVPGSPTFMSPPPIRREMSNAPSPRSPVPIYLEPRWAVRHLPLDLAPSLRGNVSTVPVFRMVSRSSFLVVVSNNQWLALPMKSSWSLEYQSFPANLFIARPSCFYLSFQWGTALYSQGWCLVSPKVNVTAPVVCIVSDACFHVDTHLPLICFRRPVT
jgi:hypothetical protein